LHLPFYAPFYFIKLKRLKLGLLINWKQKYTILKFSQCKKFEKLISQYLKKQAKIDFFSYYYKKN
jgi:hypothetical protein